MLGRYAAEDRELRLPRRWGSSTCSPPSAGTTRSPSSGLGGSYANAAMRLRRTGSPKRANSGDLSWDGRGGLVLRMAHGYLERDDPRRGAVGLA
jgi:hypothetical protein